MNKCIYCNSKNIDITETAENKITEVCNDCGEKITYDRVKVGKRGKQTYIATINYALRLVKHPKVMITATGRRRLILLDTVYAMNPGIEVLDWKQQQTELGGLELRMILKAANSNKNSY